MKVWITMLTMVWHSRFRLANAAYIPQNDNTNKTDQQKFAQIDSPESGIMTSKVYNIPESATAVGREPIGLRIFNRYSKR